VSLVLEQLLSDLHDGIPDSSFSQNDTIAKSMAKVSCKTGTALTIKEQENLVNGLLPVKTPMFLLFKTNFHHDACGGFR
jgi:DNA mismatch repair protein MutL